MKSKTIAIVLVFMFAGILITAGVLSTKEQAFTARDSYVVSEKDRLITEANYFDISDKVCELKSLDYNSTKRNCKVDYIYEHISGRLFNYSIPLPSNTTEEQDFELIWKRLRLDLQVELGKVEKFTYTERVMKSRVIDKGVLQR